MKTVFFVFLMQYLRVNSWVLTNINIPDISKTNLVDNNSEDEEFNLISKNGPEYGHINPKIALIYPGTKWCGPGDVANNFDDLGSEWRADKCCRAHDYCPDVIPGGETDHNLTNTAFYSRLSCECDETFRICLQDAGTYAAENIGKIYFNALDTKCFRNDYPIRYCSKRGNWPLKKCLKYSYDTNAPKVYQWFDVPNYREQTKNLPLEFLVKKVVFNR